MQKTRYQIGFVGAGYIASWHFKALKGLANVDLVAVCEHDEHKLTSFLSEKKLQRFTSYEEMFENAKLDAVHILLPPQLHFSVIKSALEHGLHVFSEKPLAISKLETQQLTELAKVHDKHLAVNHNFLFSPIYEKLNRLINKHELGVIKQISIIWNRELQVLNCGPFNSWLFENPAHLLLEIAPHAMAYVMHLIGFPDKIEVSVIQPETLPPGSPLIYRQWHLHAIINQVSVTIDFNFGPCYDEQSVTVRGTVGVATADFEGNRLIHRQHTAFATDYDRYRRAKKEARELKVQAGKNWMHFLLEKAKLSSAGNAFGESIQRSVHLFYSGLATNKIDPRQEASFGSAVVELCESVGAQISTSEGSKPAHEHVKKSTSVTPEHVVIGGAGFIGKELVKELAKRGQAVKVICRHPQAVPEEWHQDPLIYIEKGDLQDCEAMEKAIKSAKVVYNLVTSGGRTWEESQKVDVYPSIELAKACLRQGVKRYLYTSTIALYYAGKHGEVINESTPLPADIDKWQPYSRAKAAVEKELMKLYQSENLPVVIVRPGVVVGKESSPFHWGVGAWKYQAICQLWGQGENPLPFVLVDDVAKAIALAGIQEGIEGTSFNLIGDIRLTSKQYLDELSSYAKTAFKGVPTPIWRFYLNDLLKWAAKCLLRYPNRQKPNFRNKASAIQAAYYDNSYSKKLLGWQPEDSKSKWLQKAIQEPVDRWLN